MTRFEPDWGLILEFTRVLAAPVATVITAWIVATLGLRSYRAQRALDRRLTWLDVLHQALSRSADQFQIAGVVSGSRNGRAQLDYMREALAGSVELQRRAAEGFLYASSDAQQSLRRLGLILENAHLEIEERGIVTPDIGSRVSDACLKTANEVAADARRELRLEPLDLSKPI